MADFLDHDHDDLIAYFGYGSLVNHETLRTSYLAKFPATLSGWQRHWQARPSGTGTAINGFGPTDIALLSIHSDPFGVIDGMVVIDRLDNLASLDERERHYSRVDLAENALQIHAAPEVTNLSDLIGLDVASMLSRCFVYVGDPVAQADVPPMLLQSYLDAVMVGFEREFGVAGLERFLDSTKGFDRQMLVDRHDPYYPRSVEVSGETASRFDALLVDRGVAFRTI